jgi:hypothetical protein
VYLLKRLSSARCYASFSHWHRLEGIWKGDPVGLDVGAGLCPAKNFHVSPTTAPHRQALFRRRMTERRGSDFTNTFLIYFCVRRVLSGLDALQRYLGMVIFGCRKTFQPLLSRLRHLDLNISEFAGESLCRKAFRCLAFRLVLLREVSKRFNLGSSCRLQRIFGGKEILDKLPACQLMQASAS